MEFHEWEQVCYPKAEHSAQHGPGSMFILTCSCPGMRSSNYTYSEYKAYQIQNKVLHKRNHHTHLPCRRAWQPTLVLLPGEFHGLRSLGQATVHKIVKSRAWLKWLSILARTPFCSFLGGSVVKNLPATEETCVQLLGWEDPLEKEMVTHSSILAWEIPWTEQPGRLQSLGSQRVGQELVTEQQQYSMEIQRFEF